MHPSKGSTSWESESRSEQEVHDFWNFIRNVNVQQGKLPLVHSTDLLTFREIRRSDKLVPHKCDVFDGQHLLYFFYGRPSYRVNNGIGTTTAKWFAPICFIFGKPMTDKYIRIMPFDSGAYANRMMHPPMHESVPLDAYELAIDAKAPMKLISVFYGNERAYFDKFPLPEVVSETLSWENLEVQAYDQLLRNRSNSSSDDRVSAIEIQIGEDIVLQNAVEAIVLPAAYLDSPGVRHQIERWGAIPLPYYIGHEFSPREVAGQIQSEVREFLINTNRL